MGSNSGAHSVAVGTRVTSHPPLRSVGAAFPHTAPSSGIRRDPFARDLALDPGGTTMPRITALHMLRSTMRTVSAPASSSFRGSLPHPTQPLCTLRVRRRRRLTQHSLPGGLLELTWAGLAPADRASFAWRLQSLDHLHGEGEQLIGNVLAPSSIEATANSRAR